jgi:dephospho-CoA kinase
VKKPFLVLGLTGGIGSGKSTVASIFKELGARGMDADAVGHRVLDRPDLAARLAKIWGGTILRGGRVDRAALAAFAFRSRADVDRLNAAVHPFIRRELSARLRRERRAGGLFILDAALLLEAGIGHWCDAIVYVHVPRALRLRRVASRGWDDRELRRRERFQWPVARKRARADFVVNNGGPLAATRRQVVRIHDRLSKVS